MDIKDIFISKAEHLFWKRLSSNQVIDLPIGKLIPKNEAYYVVRMKEMYLKTTRKYWRRLYPMLHAFIEDDFSETHAVVGPGQLKELGEKNLDRIVNLNQRLSGPTVFRGGDVSVLVGLYSVPGEDASKALVDTVSTVANLGGFALNQSIQIANVVKAGIENIVGLNEARLELGIRDSFFQNNPLQSGYYVGINGPETQINLERIWLKDGRLIEGDDPFNALPFEKYDYMVLEVEHVLERDDWPGIPEIENYQEKFSQIMKENTTVSEKKEKLGVIWPQFTEVLYKSQYLTELDSERIGADVAADLNKRLQKMESGNPFESTRGHDQIIDYDFLDIPNFTDMTDPASMRNAKKVFIGNPFI